MNATRYPYISVWAEVTVSGRTYHVHKYSICASYTVVCTAYELTTGGAFSRSHHTITHREDRKVLGWLGAVTSRNITPEVDALPVGPERSAACRAHWFALEAEAYEAILAAFPEMADGESHRGEIEIQVAA